MGRRCTICTHPRAEEINAALDDGTPVAEIARAFGVQRPSINRHRGTHLAARIDPIPLNLLASETLEQVDSLTREADRIRRAAESSGDLRLALQAVRELASLVEMAAKLRGEMPEEATVNVVQIAQWSPWPRGSAVRWMLAC